MKRSSSGLSLVFIAFLCLAIATVSNFHSNEQTSLLYAQLIFFSNQQTLADPCYTTEGEIGNCTSVRSCYPKVKLPKLSNLKSWSTASLRGTCHYLENGKQVTIFLILKIKYLLDTCKRISHSIYSADSNNNKTIPIQIKMCSPPGLWSLLPIKE